MGRFRDAMFPGVEEVPDDMLSQLTIAVDDPGGAYWPLWRILIIAAIFVAVVLESRYTRARLRGGDRILVVGWVIRILAIGPAILFWWVAAGLLLRGPVNVLAGVFWPLMVLFGTGLAAWTLVYRVIYSAERITIVTLLHPLRGITLPWCDVHDIVVEDDKIRLLTSARRYRIETRVLRGSSELEAFVAELIKERNRETLEVWPEGLREAETGESAGNTRL